ncbi:MAG: hybrid sensor histidine kinase/response regulator [Ilumatobacteraceae bacterium]|nr:hybrid sensor histidine kinase/response regulator [Ilumatobacteraceae bacterium]
MTRALVVDDDAANRYYLESLLTANGFEVDVATNGVEALATARRAVPDVVISDLLMPVMDGYTLMRHWKADERLKQSPFIVYTATYTGFEDERLAVNLGVDAFIVKPAEPDALLARLREVLAKGSATVATSPREPVADDNQSLREYSETLIRKLEEKTLQLEATNRALREDIIERERVRIENQQLTEHLQALAEQLEIERARLVAAERVARMGSWEADLRTSEVLWSDETAPIFENSTEEVEPSHVVFLTVVHPDDRATVADTFLRSLGQTGPQEIEYRLLMPDGRIKYISERWQVYFDENGEPLRVLGTCQDVTERRQAEEALRESETLYRNTAAQLTTVLANSLDVICSFDSDDRMVLMNVASERAFGYSPGALLGTSYLDAVVPEDRERTRLLFLAAKAGAPVRSFENRCYRRDGTIVHLQWNVQWSEEEQIMFCVGRDITDAKQLEVQFLRAQRMESIGTMAGGIAHDLNNVLSPIILSIDLLKLGEADERKMDILTIVEASAQRGADMVKQLLSVAREVDLDHVEVRVGDLLCEVKKIADETFSKTIDVRLDVDGDLWVVEGDPTQLHQVLLNLCVNARDAMPNGGTLKLSAHNVALNDRDAQAFIDAVAGPYVVVTVEDNGTGMTANVLDRAFEPFFTTKGVGKGTGLGLSASQAIVRRHGGYVRASSELGVGTSFAVYLPADPELASRPPDEARDDLLRGGGELILVVDDDEAVSQITRQILETFGYRTLSAVDGLEAVALHAAHGDEIAVVITDMMMPNMDGLTLIAALMRSDPDVKIIAASGLNANEIVAAARHLGVALFIAKPFTAELLLNSLHSVLSSEASKNAR